MKMEIWFDVAKSEGITIELDEVDSEIVKKFLKAFRGEVQKVFFPDYEEEENTLKCPCGCELMSFTCPCPNCEGEVFGCVSCGDSFSTGDLNILRKDKRGIYCSKCVGFFNENHECFKSLRAKRDKK